MNFKKRLLNSFKEQTSEKLPGSAADGQHSQQYNPSEQPPGKSKTNVASLFNCQLESYEVKGYHTPDDPPSRDGCPLVLEDKGHTVMAELEPCLFPPVQNPVVNEPAIEANSAASHELSTACLQESMPGTMTCTTPKSSAPNYFDVPFDNIGNMPCEFPPIVCRDDASRREVEPSLGVDLGVKMIPSPQELQSLQWQLAYNNANDSSTTSSPLHRAFHEQGLLSQCHNVFGTTHNSVVECYANPEQVEVQNSVTHPCAVAKPTGIGKCNSSVNNPPFSPESKTHVTSPESKCNFQNSWIVDVPTLPYTVRSPNRYLADDCFSKKNKSVLHQRSNNSQVYGLRNVRPLGITRWPMTGQIVCQGSSTDAQNLPWQFNMPNYHLSSQNNAYSSSKNKVSWGVGQSGSDTNKLEQHSHIKLSEIPQYRPHLIKIPHVLIPNDNNLSITMEDQLTQQNASQEAWGQLGMIDSKNDVCDERYFDFLKNDGYLSPNNQSKTQWRLEQKDTGINPSSNMVSLPFVTYEQKQNEQYKYIFEPNSIIPSKVIGKDNNEQSQEIQDLDNLPNRLPHNQLPVTQSITPHLEALQLINSPMFASQIHHPSTKKIPLKHHCSSCSPSFRSIDSQIPLIQPKDAYYPVSQHHPIWQCPMSQHLRPASKHLRPTSKHPRTALQHPRSASQHPRLALHHPRSASQNPRSASQHPRLASQNPRLASQNPRLASQHPRLASQHPRLESQQSRPSLQHLTVSLQPPMLQHPPSLYQPPVLQHPPVSHHPPVMQYQTPLEKPHTASQQHHHPFQHHSVMQHHSLQHRDTSQHQSMMQHHHSSQHYQPTSQHHHTPAQYHPYFQQHPDWQQLPASQQQLDQQQLPLSQHHSHRQHVLATQQHPDRQQVTASQKHPDRQQHRISQQHTNQLQHQSSQLNPDWQQHQSSQLYPDRQQHHSSQLYPDQQQPCSSQLCTDWQQHRFPQLYHDLQEHQASQQYPDPQQHVASRWAPDQQQHPASQWAPDPQQHPASQRAPDPQQHPASRRAPDPQQRPASQRDADPQQLPASHWDPDPQQLPASHRDPDPQQLPASHRDPDPQQLPASHRDPDPQQLPTSHQDPDPQQLPASHRDPDPQQLPASHRLPDPQQLPASHRDPDPQQLPASHRDHHPQQLPASHRDPDPQQLPASHRDPDPQQLPASHRDHDPQQLSASHRDPNPQQLPASHRDPDPQQLPASHRDPDPQQRPASQQDPEQQQQQQYKQSQQQHHLASPIFQATDRSSPLPSTPRFSSPQLTVSFGPTTQLTPSPCPSSHLHIATLQASQMSTSQVDVSQIVVSTAQNPSIKNPSSQNLSFKNPSLKCPSSHITTSSISPPYSQMSYIQPPLTNPYCHKKIQQPSIYSNATAEQTDTETWCSQLSSQCTRFKKQPIANTCIAQAPITSLSHPKLSALLSFTSDLKSRHSHISELPIQHQALSQLSDSPLSTDLFEKVPRFTSSQFLSSTIEKKARHCFVPASISSQKLHTPSVPLLSQAHQNAPTGETSNHSAIVSTVPTQRPLALTPHTLQFTQSPTDIPQTVMVHHALPTTTESTPCMPVQKMCIPASEQSVRTLHAHNESGIEHVDSPLAMIKSSSPLHPGMCPLVVVKRLPLQFPFCERVNLSSGLLSNEYSSCFDEGPMASIGNGEKSQENNSRVLLSDVSLMEHSSLDLTTVLKDENASAKSTGVCSVERCSPDSSTVEVSSKVWEIFLARHLNMISDGTECQASDISSNHPTTLMTNLHADLRELAAAGRCPLPCISRLQRVFAPVGALRDLMFSPLLETAVVKIFRRRGVVLRPATLREERELELVWPMRQNVPRTFTLFPLDKLHEVYMDLIQAAIGDRRKDAEVGSDLHDSVTKRICKKDSNLASRKGNSLADIDTADVLRVRRKCDLKAKAAPSKQEARDQNKSEPKLDEKQSYHQKKLRKTSQSPSQSLNHQVPHSTTCDELDLMAENRLKQPTQTEIRVASSQVSSEVTANTSDDDVIKKTRMTDHLETATTQKRRRKAKYKCERKCNATKQRVPEKGNPGHTSIRLKKARKERKTNKKKGKQFLPHLMKSSMKSAALIRKQMLHCQAISSVLSEKNMTPVDKEGSSSEDSDESLPAFLSLVSQMEGPNDPDFEGGTTEDKQDSSNVSEENEADAEVSHDTETETFLECATMVARW